MLGFDDRTRAILDAVQRHGSLSAAARALGLDPANARRHVRTAERRAGARLVEARRGGRGARNAWLTPAARRRLGHQGIPGRVVAHDPEEGVSRVKVGAREILVAGEHAPGPVMLTVPPESVGLELPSERPREARSPRNAIPVRVQQVADEGNGAWRIVLAAGALRLESLVTRGAIRELRLRPGRRVVAVVKAVAVRVSR